MSKPVIKTLIMLWEVLIGAVSGFLMWLSKTPPDFWQRVDALLWTCITAIVMTSLSYLVRKMWKRIFQDND